MFSKNLIVAIQNFTLIQHFYNQNNGTRQSTVIFEFKVFDENWYGYGIIGDDLPTYQIG